MPSLSSYPFPYPENIQSSLHILGFPTDTPPSSLKELNKKYHLLALKHHPDKAGFDTGKDASIDSTERFKEINEAHKCVKEYFYGSTSFAFHGNSDDNEVNMDTAGYDSILQLFIKTVIVKMAKTEVEADPTAIQSLIHLIITKGIHSAVLLFRNMDKQSSITIYEILSKNQELFGISREIMDELTTIVEEKTRDDIVIRLNPSLLDMLLDRVYILQECGQPYYIPLWHGELHFKQPLNAGEIIVLCEPELPDNVSIDENNNLYISLEINVLELFEKQILPIYINDEIKTHGFVYYLHAGDVSLQSSVRQCVLLRGITGDAGCGGVAICNTQTSDIYKINTRGKVYANIRLVH